MSRMLFKKRFAVLALFALSAVVVTPAAVAGRHLPSHFINDDDTFMALREAARHDDSAQAAQYADQLRSYALPSYVEYYRLRPRLRSASAVELTDFLKR